MRKHFEVFAIYFKSSVVKACLIFNGEVLRVNFVARVSTDKPLTESTPAYFSLGRTIRAHDFTDHPGYGYETFIRTCG
jgi:GTP-binding protein EngB required for normal cell division